MKDNYSWLDSELYDLVEPYTDFLTKKGFKQVERDVEVAKQTIISQIEIEKLRARIDEQMFIRNNLAYGKLKTGWMNLSVKGMDEQLADLTEKLKELEK